VAIDSTVLHARGGVWHKKHRDAGMVPHTSIDTEFGWTEAGWHGWKLHLVTAVVAARIPQAAELTPANTADNEPAVRNHCFGVGRLLIATVPSAAWVKLSAGVGSQGERLND
jgi:hypothetical protein